MATAAAAGALAPARTQPVGGPGGRGKPIARKAAARGSAEHHDALVLQFRADLIAGGLAKVGCKRVYDVLVDKYNLEDITSVQVKVMLRQADKQADEAAHGSGKDEDDDGTGPSARAKPLRTQAKRGAHFTWRPQCWSCEES